MVQSNKSRNDTPDVSRQQKHPTPVARTVAAMVRNPHPLDPESRISPFTTTLDASNTKSPQAFMQTSRTPKYDSYSSGTHSARALLKQRTIDKSTVTPTKATRPTKTGACTTPTLKNLETRRSSRDATWKKESKSQVSTPLTKQS